VFGRLRRSPRGWSGLLGDRLFEIRLLLARLPFGYISEELVHIKVLGLRRPAVFFRDGSILGPLVQGFHCRKLFLDKLFFYVHELFHKLVDVACLNVLTGSLITLSDVLPLLLLIQPSLGDPDEPAILGRHLFMFWEPKARKMSNIQVGEGLGVVELCSLATGIPTKGRTTVQRAVWQEICW
jgi:hypothetical protein